MTKPVVVLGICGSIAAYKAADLTSKLTQNGITVQVMMTKSACQLVQPQTFLTLSQQPVITGLWDMPTWQPEHIALAERANLLVIAPASANMIGKIANGIGDDALSTFALAHTGPMIVVPAMNPRMWNNVVVQENCAKLRQRGIIILQPDAGRVACGESGQGRFPEPKLICEFILAKLALDQLGLPQNIQTKKVLITAGPTREKIDPVRFLTNRSTGKMGFALATVAAALGCDVTLISGPVNLTTPLHCERIDIESAAEMKTAVENEITSADILIMCAAVADYTPANVAEQKIHKQGDMALELQRTDDVLMSIKDLKQPHQCFVGFAAETEDLHNSAVSKLNRKNLDFIIANDVSRQDIGFNSCENEVIIFAADGSKTEIPKQSKLQIATNIIKQIMAKK